MNTEGVRYDELMADAKHQIRLLFVELATSCVGDVLPNMDTKMVEGLDCATNPDVYAQVNLEMTTWEHR